MTKQLELFGNEAWWPGEGLAILHRLILAGVLYQEEANDGGERDVQGLRLQASMIVENPSPGRVGVRKLHTHQRRKAA